MTKNRFICIQDIIKNNKFYIEKEFEEFDNIFHIHEITRRDLEEYEYLSKINVEESLLFLLSKTYKISNQDNEFDYISIRELECMNQSDIFLLIDIYHELYNNQLFEDYLNNEDNKGNILFYWRIIDKFNTNIEISDFTNSFYKFIDKALEYENKAKNRSSKFKHSNKLTYDKNDIE